MRKPVSRTGSGRERGGSIIGGPLVILRAWWRAVGRASHDRPAVPGPVVLVVVGDFLAIAQVVAAVDLAEGNVGPALANAVLALLLAMEAVHAGLAHLIELLLAALDLGDILLQRLLCLPDGFLGEPIADFHQGAGGVTDLLFVAALPGRIDGEGNPHGVHHVARHIDFGLVREISGQFVDRPVPRAARRAGRDDGYGVGVSEAIIAPVEEF